jgi:CRP/FNR family transcriptional regulator, cyclic AMP receptor protein
MPAHASNRDIWRTTLRRMLRALALRIGLPVDAALALANDATLARHARGDVIFGPTNTHTFSYVVVSGVVRLECRDHRNRPTAVQLVPQGRLFGVSWHPQVTPRAIYAVAQTDVVAGVLEQRAIVRLFGTVPERARMNLLSYATRALSAICAQKATMRGLSASERLRLALQDLIPSFGQREGNSVALDIALSSADLAVLIGTGEGRVRHVLSELREQGFLSSARGRFVVPVLPREPGIPEKADGDLLEPAEWARPRLRDALSRAERLGLNQRSVDFLAKTAALFSVPDGQPLLPPTSANVVAFVVEGSAWLEAARANRSPVALQIVPHGRFVRLPTAPSSRGIRLLGRAHRSCVVAVLTSDAMAEAMSINSVDGQRNIHDVIARQLSRYVCDVTTAPTRVMACRLLSAFVALAREFGTEAEGGTTIDLELTREDLAHLIDGDVTTVSKVKGILTNDQRLTEDASGRYVVMPGTAATVCPYCNPTIVQGGSTGGGPPLP